MVLWACYKSHFSIDSSFENRSQHPHHLHRSVTSCMFDENIKLNLSINATSACQTKFKQSEARRNCVWRTDGAVFCVSLLSHSCCSYDRKQVNTRHAPSKTNWSGWMIKVHSQCDYSNWNIHKPHAGYWLLIVNPVPIASRSRELNFSKNIMKKKRFSKDRRCREKQNAIIVKILITSNTFIQPRLRCIHGVAHIEREESNNSWLMTLAQTPGSAHLSPVSLNPDVEEVQSKEHYFDRIILPPFGGWWAPVSIRTAHLEPFEKVVWHYGKHAYSLKTMDSPLVF